MPDRESLPSPLRIDPIEELLVAGYLVAPTGRFRYMPELRAWAHDEAKALRRVIEKAAS